MLRYDINPSFHVLNDSLSRVYGVPSHTPLPLGNKQDPLDELIYIMLTVMTEFGVDAVYSELRAAYPRWDAVIEREERELAAALRPIGLYWQRARRIRQLLSEIKAREGSATLKRLYQMDDPAVESYLTSLPGVGKKVARCVMLYSLGRDVFPVDAHVLRVLKRLGLADDGLTLKEAQDALQPIVPEVLRFTLHVNLVIHGRTICRARVPRCGECVLRVRCRAVAAG